MTHHNCEESNFVLIIKCDIMSILQTYRYDIKSQHVDFVEFYSDEKVIFMAYFLRASLLIILKRHKVTCIVHIVL